MTHVAAGSRLPSLDAFRGLVIVLMLLVNAAGTDPAFPAWFAHRGWNGGDMGIGLADLVYPWFLFIAGVSIPFSIERGRGATLSPARRIVAAATRGARLYLLGVMLVAASVAYASPIGLSILLRWDILQMIGLATLVATCAAHLPRTAQVLLVAAALLFKWAILTQVPMPGRDDVAWTATESVQAWIRAEWGWLGTALTQGLPAAAVTVLGSLAGRELLRSDGSTRARNLLLLRGGVMATCGVAWHLLGDMPMSKDFFTSSFVLVASGTACLLLGGMHDAFDRRGFRPPAMLVHLGTNAIAIYVFAELAWRTCLSKWLVVTPGGGASTMFVAFKAWLSHLTNPTVGAWLVVAAYIGSMCLLARALHARGWFIRA
jgi:predicted acyltransferase